MNYRSCALITPGHCASSLAIHRLKQEGYEVGPPGEVDDRHPQGTYDWMELLKPQIDGDWAAYTAAVRAATAAGPFAFKLQSGLIHWGVEALRALPGPVRVIVLDRDDRAWIVQHIGGRSGDQWVWDWSRATMRAVAAWNALRVGNGWGEGASFWTKEELCTETTGS